MSDLMQAPVQQQSAYSCTVVVASTLQAPGPAVFNPKMCSQVQFRPASNIHVEWLLLSCFCCLCSPSCLWTTPACFKLR
jgi:hypothetical protein